MSEAGGAFFIENVQRGQWGPATVDATIKQVATSDGKDCGQREEKEGGSAGVAVIAARAKSLVGYDYKGVPVSGDKITRAKPFRAQCEAGNVYLVRTGDAARDEWIEPYIQELCAFPTGKNDDQVDGSSCAFNAVLLETPPGGVMAGRVTW
jgi:predicted phage terminase large subunit-like protein